MTGGCCAKHGAYYPAYPGCPECRQERDMWPETGRVLRAQGAEVRKRMDQLDTATARAEAAEAARDAAERALRKLELKVTNFRWHALRGTIPAEVSSALWEQMLDSREVIAAADKREAGQ